MKRPLGDIPAQVDRSAGEDLKEPQALAVASLSKVAAIRTLTDSTVSAGVSAVQDTVFHTMPSLPPSTSWMKVPLRPAKRCCGAELRWLFRSCEFMSGT